MAQAVHDPSALSRQIGSIECVRQIPVGSSITSTVLVPSGRRVSVSSAGAVAEANHRNERIGWSLISFGATPCWLWKKSENATPVISAFPQSLTAALA